MTADNEQNAAPRLRQSEYTPIIESFPFFTSLPKLARIRLLDKTTLKVFSQLDNNNSTTLVDNLNFVHMISGSLLITPSNEGSAMVINTGECLNPEALKKQNVFSISRFEVKQISKGLVVSNSDYKAFINSESSYSEKISKFIINAIPKLLQYGIRKQAEVLSFFQVKKYNPGVVIFEEGKSHDNIYLVYEGECLIKMKQNKYLQEALFKTIGTGSQQNATIMPHGLLSSTAITAQIGLLSPGSWFGEEIVILSSPVMYSATARNYCTLLVIRSSNFANLPGEILTEMAEKTKQKSFWLIKRLEQLTKISAEILNQDMENRIYQKSVRKLEKEFPQAHPRAVQNLSKMILKHEPELTPSIFNKLGYIRGRMCNSTLKTYKQSSNMGLSFFKRRRQSPESRRVRFTEYKANTKKGLKVRFDTTQKEDSLTLPAITKGQK